ncbi:MAG: hypothetical protein F2671_08305 [Actinobacteria bacterium]|nr:hypothetical protein [Actinomycetota bacterium]
MPFTQEIVFDATLVGAVAAVAVLVVVAAVADEEVAVGWLNFTRIVGLEKVKPVAESRRKPPTSLMVVVETLDSPLSPTTETVAATGASVNP